MGNFCTYCGSKTLPSGACTCQAYMNTIADAELRELILIEEEDEKYKAQQANSAYGASGVSYYQQPNTNYQQPNTNYQQPNTNYQQPNTNETNISYYQTPNTSYQTYSTQHYNDQIAATTTSKAAKVLAIISFVTSMIGSILSFLAMFGLYIVILSSVAGIITSAISSQKGNTNLVKMRKAGLVLGIIGTILGLIFAYFGLMAFSGSMN